MLAKLSKHHIWRRVIHMYAPALIALLLPAVVFAIGASAEVSHTLPGAAPTTQAMSGPGAPQRLMGGLIGTPRTTAGGQRASPAASPPPCGLAWRVIPSPNIGTNSNYLSGVLALSPSDVWIAGGYDNDILAGRTLIAHWNGSAWTVIDSPNPGNMRNYLGPMAALSANDIWATGYYGNNGDPIPIRSFTEHWDGSTWSVVPSPNISGDNILFAVAALATNDVWAVGAGGLIVHWDGTVWNLVPGPSPSAPGTNLYGVAAVSTNDVWASGEHFVNGRPQTLLGHWDGSHWTVVPSPSPGVGRSNRFYRIAATSGNDVWAVGEYTDEVSTSRTLVEHWDGTQWSIVPSPNGGDPTSLSTINTLFGVAAASTNDAWAVGYYREYYGAFYYIDHPLIEHWDGTQWVVASADEVGTGGSSLEWIAPLSSGDVWAVGFFTNESYHAQTLVERFSDPCATPTATPTSTPSATPTPNGCSVCNLSVTRVTVSCNPDGTVHWSATVRNTGDCPVYDGWQANLQVKLRRGHFATVRTQSGSTSFPPGRTTVSGDICYQFASNTAAVRAEFAPDRGRARCNPHGRSDSMPPCNRTASCP